MYGCDGGSQKVTETVQLLSCTVWHFYELIFRALRHILIENICLLNCDSAIGTIWQPLLQKAHIKQVTDVNRPIHDSCAGIEEKILPSIIQMYTTDHSHTVFNPSRGARK